MSKAPGGTSAGAAGTGQVVRNHPWNQQHEKVLKARGEECAGYRWLHMKSHQMLAKISFWITIPVIIISTITGTASFAHGTFPEEWSQITPLVIGGMNLIAGIITTVAQFLKVNERVEGHRVAALAYDKLANSIQEELKLAASERSMSGLDMIEKVRVEFERLLEQSPMIKPAVAVDFDKMFQYISTRPQEPLRIMKPSLLDVREIEVFNPNELAPPNPPKIVTKITDAISAAVPSNPFARMAPPPSMESLDETISGPVGTPRDLIAKELEQRFAAGINRRFSYSGPSAETTAAPPGLVSSMAQRFGGRIPTSSIPPVNTNGLTSSFIDSVLKSVGSGVNHDDLGSIARNPTRTPRPSVTRPVVPPDPGSQDHDSGIAPSPVDGVPGTSEQRDATAVVVNDPPEVHEGNI